jgi:hypothetical protein
LSSELRHLECVFLYLPCRHYVMSTICLGTPPFSKATRTPVLQSLHQGRVQINQSSPGVPKRPSLTGSTDSYHFTVPQPKKSCLRPPSKMLIWDCPGYRFRFSLPQPVHHAFRSHRMQREDAIRKAPHQHIAAQRSTSSLRRGASSAKSLHMWSICCEGDSPDSTHWPLCWLPAP